MNVAPNQKILRVSQVVAAGQTTVDCTIVDMQGYEVVTFYASIGVIGTGGNTSIKAQHGTQAGGGDMTDIAGSSIAYLDSDDGKVAVLEIVRPRNRYVRCNVVRATQNSVVDSVIAVLSRVAKAPVAQASTDVVGLKSLVSPASGTA